MQTLARKIAIVTGASSGIGRATAKLFARHGAKTVITARRRVLLETLTEEIACDGGEAIAITGDLTSPGFPEILVRTAEERFGGLDVAFNNAGIIGPMAATPTVSIDDWRHVIDNNLNSAFLCAKHQLPAMVRRGGGSLIFTSSFVGHTAGLPGMAAYAASKAGLTGLMKVIAAEYGAQNIRANALLPGGTDTPMQRTFNTTEDTEAWVRGIHALRRIAAPEEIAQAALFLASDAASFITGCAMLVDGGVSISRA